MIEGLAQPDYDAGMSSPEAAAPSHGTVVPFARKDRAWLRLLDCQQACS
jgi:hypothetical protein